MQWIEHLQNQVL